MYNKVIISFDGSEGSIKALEHAIQISKSFGSALSIVHVSEETPKQVITPEPNIGRNIAIGYGAKPMEERKMSVQNGRTSDKNHLVFKEAREKVESEGIHTQFKVLEGDPAKQITEYASLNNVDVIVIGSRGFSGIKKLVLGSISEKVVKEADVPVLVVK